MATKRLGDPLAEAPAEKKARLAEVKEQTYAPMILIKKERKQKEEDGERTPHLELEDPPPSDVLTFLKYLLTRFLENLDKLAPAFHYHVHHPKNKQSGFQDAEAIAAASETAAALRASLPTIVLANIVSATTGKPVLGKFRALYPIYVFLQELMIPEPDLRLTPQERVLAAKRQAFECFRIFAHEWGHLLSEKYILAPRDLFITPPGVLYGEAGRAVEVYLFGGQAAMNSNDTVNKFRVHNLLYRPVNEAEPEWVVLTDSYVERLYTPEFWTSITDWRALYPDRESNDTRDMTAAERQKDRICHDEDGLPGAGGPTSVETDPRMLPRDDVERSASDRAVGRRLFRID